jgi:class 3 adenylate cyclase
MECKACGGQNPPGKRFCADCGTPLTAGLAEQDKRREPVPERRQLTVMFVDLVGSTSLGTRLDAEELREVILAYQSCITAIVSRSDGLVARYMGDGALIYFGYPQAHEDDAERAVRAALEIIEAVCRLSTVAGPAGTLACRVGIATGGVVVGDVIGFGSSRESPVVGETPNLAAGLVTKAEPGMVVVDNATRRLTSGLFDYNNLAPAQLKGSPVPVRAWAALAERPIDSRFEALRTSNLPLMGRTEELDLLRRRWGQAKNGEGRVVLITGEPGIGKSRLLLALEHEVEQAQHARIRFLCSPHYQDSPLFPIVHQIERAASFERHDPPTVKMEKLSRLLEADSSSNPDVSVIADLVSIRRSENGLPDHHARQGSKDQILAAVLRQFDRLTRYNPLLVIFEDIQWADPTTLDLLDLLIERVERLRILLVITARPELQPPWVIRPQVTVLMLSGLYRLEAAALIRAVAGERILPDDVVDKIIARADGIPLFIEELTKTVLDTQSRRGTDRQHSPAELPSAEIVPTSLQSSLMARLDRLAAGKQVAQIASVIGREFSFELLQGCCGLPRKPLLEALGELVQTGLAIAHGQAPYSVYAFKHALMQDVAYASLMHERRRAIHLRLAEFLQKDDMRSESALPEIIARHFAEAGMPDRSIDYYLKAAERTTGRFALAEKASHLRKGLRQIDHLRPSMEVDRRELSLQLALGQVLIDYQGSGSEEMRVAFERARELCFKLDDMKELFRVHDGLLNYHFSHSEPDKVLGYANEMLDVGRRTGEPQAFLVARRSAGFANLLLGRFEMACNEMQQLVDTYDRQRDGPEVALATRDVKMSAYTVLGICLTALGHLDSGAARSMEAVTHAELLNHAVSRIVALRRACVQRMMRRDNRTVLELSERLLKLAAEFETFKGVRDGTIFHCWAQLQTSREPGLLEGMLACIKQFDATGHWAMLPFFMASAAEVMGHQGDIVGALPLLDRAAELVRLTGEQWSQAEILRLQACFGPRDQALSLLHVSLDKATEQKAKLWELRTATSLANFWLDNHDQTAARRVLVPVQAWFTEGSDAPDLIAARALLDRINRAGDNASRPTHGYQQAERVKSLK